MASVFGLGWIGHYWKQLLSGIFESEIYFRKRLIVMLKKIIRLSIKAVICFLMFILTTYGWQPIFTKQDSKIVYDPKVEANLRSTVKVLSEDIGIRNYRFQANLDKAEEFVVRSFESLGYTVTKQEYKVWGKPFRNIIAHTGQDIPNSSVIVGAHYDSCSTPGADDNASGVAGLLELARQMRNVPTKTPIVFVAFVNEEPPFFTTEAMGSLVFTKYLKANHKSVKAAVILEMLGFYNEGFASQKYLPLIGPFYPNQADFVAVVGNFPSKHLVNNLKQGMGHGSNFPVRSIVAPSSLPGIYFSDHWSFWEMGYPAVMVTDTAYLRYKHYHELSDTMEKLDFSKMSKVVHGLRTGIESVANEMIQN